jgi:hypothetical protein
MAAKEPRALPVSPEKQVLRSAQDDNHKKWMAIIKVNDDHKKWMRIVKLMTIIKSGLHRSPMSTARSSRRKRRGEPRLYENASVVALDRIGGSGALSKRHHEKAR